jgi:hypothetical protein
LSLGEQAGFVKFIKVDNLAGKVSGTIAGTISILQFNIE